MHTIPEDIDKSEMYKVNLDYNGEREMSTLSLRDRWL